MATLNEKPNIIFILVDDMGYGDFSIFNGGLSQTPSLDALINESLCLTQHYTASPVCNPSRACLLTGRYPHRTGSIDTLEWWGLERLALRETTLADVLKSSGYITGLFGKWHLGSFDPRYHPNRRGFDEAVCFRGGMHDYYNWRLEYNDNIRYADGRYLTDVFTDEAVSFIQRHKNDQPFFLHVTYNAPHSPLAAPLEDIKPFTETGKFSKGVSMIYAMIRRMDQGVSRILETLKKCNLEKNTVVMFSSDNGPQFGGEGENCTTRFNCQFNGAKGSVYEGGIRVPMIIRWPDGLPAGETRSEMIHFSDWFPTLLTMAGVKIPNHLKLDGMNVLPVLQDKSTHIAGNYKGTIQKRFWQWNRYEPLVTSNAAVRDGDWKLIRPALEAAGEVPDIQWLWVSMYGPDYFINKGIFKPPFPQREVPVPPPPELYNIKDDPLEKENIALKHPNITKNLLKELDNWFLDVEADRAAIEDSKNFRN